MQLRIFPFQRMVPVRQDRCIQMDSFHGFRLARHEMTRQAWIWVDRRGNIFDFWGEIWKRFRGNPLRGRWSDHGLSGRCILDSAAWKHFWPERERGRGRGRDQCPLSSLKLPLPGAADLIFSTNCFFIEKNFSQGLAAVKDIYFHQIPTVQMSEAALVNPIPVKGAVMDHSFP